MWGIPKQTIMEQGIIHRSTENCHGNQKLVLF